jgi:hypothetical protein
MNLIEKLNSYLPVEEKPEPLTYSYNGYDVVELLDFVTYSLIVMYQGNFICSRGTFRRQGCVEYKKKRAIYIGELQLELDRLKLEY